MLDRLHALVRTTAVRLALRQAAFLLVALALMLAALFVVLDRYATHLIEVSLMGEGRALATLPPSQRMQSLGVLTQVRGGARQRYYRLEDVAGRPLAGTLPQWPESLPADGRVHRVEVALPHDEEGDHDSTANLPTVGFSLADGARLLIAQSPGEIEDLRELAFGLAAAMLGLAALLAIVMGVSLGRQWLVRIDAINRVAGRIASGDLGQRVPSRGQGDEFDLLAGHLNAMLARIEAAVAGMREVSDNVAHDLRRPLTRLRTRIEVALRQPRDADAYRTALEEALRDSGEMLATFEALLTIARLEAGSEWLQKEILDVAAVARDVAELYAAEMEAGGRPFAVSADTEVRLAGSPALIAQALANLLDNALKYTPARTAIEIEVRREDERVRVSVVDHGPGLTDADKVRLVGRFARGDEARSTPGNGLGLALVAAVAHAHGGSLTPSDTPGGGLSMHLDLPLAKERHVESE